MLRMLFAVVAGFGLLFPTPSCEGKPIKVLIITGDHGHAWKETTPFLKDVAHQGRA